MLVTAWVGGLASEGAREHALLDAHEGIARAATAAGSNSLGSLRLRATSRARLPKPDSIL